MTNGFGLANSRTISRQVAKASTNANMLSKAGLGCNGGVYGPDHPMNPLPPKPYETRNLRSAMPICGEELALGAIKHPQWLHVDGRYKSMTALGRSVRSLNS